MPDESARQRLNHYLSGAREDAIGNAGKDWQKKGELLQVVSEALRNRGPELAERLGKDSQTAAQLREALLKASVRMETTSRKLADAGDALVVVGDNIEKARADRKAMRNLVEPPPFVEPTYAGAQPTPDEILDAAVKRAASNKEHGDYRAASTGQEADAAEITRRLDEAFLGAIPPMMAIHGGPDPTKRKRNGGGEVALVQFSGETEDERRSRRRRERAEQERRRELERLRQAEYERRDQAERDRAEAERERQERLERERAEREQRERERLERERLERERLDQQLRDRERHLYTPTPVPTTNVEGGTDAGTTYQVADSTAPTSSQSSTPGSAPASSGSSLGSTLGVGAGVAGAGGAVIRAGASTGGVVAATFGGSVSAGTSSAAIGAGGRVGAPGSLGGATGAAGSAPRAPGTVPGSAGSPSAARSTNGRSAAGRSTGASRSNARGAGDKGKGLFRRGSNGSTTGGRGTRKDDERADQREALVYDQDWLGDDSAAPGVLD